MALPNIHKGVKLIFTSTVDSFCHAPWVHLSIYFPTHPLGVSRLRPLFKNVRVRFTIRSIPPLHHTFENLLHPKVGHTCTTYLWVSRPPAMAGLSKRLKLIHSLWPASVLVSIMMTGKYPEWLTNNVQENRLAKVLKVGWLANVLVD
jgi:hypothetical protein